MARGDESTATNTLEQPPRYTADVETNFRSISDWQYKFFQQVRVLLDGFEARLAAIEGVSEFISDLSQYQSVDEVVSSLPSDNSKNIVYSVNVGELAAGDMIWATGTVAVTNSTGSNASVGMELFLSTEQDALGNVSLTEASARAHNAGETQVHERTGYHEVNQSYEDAWVHVAMFANQAVDIEDNGDVKAIVSRQAEAPDS
jgi:hypothetical protein